MTVDQPWSEDSVEQLRKLRVEGWSASQIAARMHRTRNAIIGKLKRIGLVGNGAPKPHVKQWSERQKKESDGIYRAPKLVPPKPKPKYNGSWFKPMPHTPPKPPRSPTPPVLAPDASKAIPIEKLRVACCRYPVTGGRPPYMYCGGKTTGPLDSWCEFHKKIVFTPEGYAKYQSKLCAKS